MKKLLIKIGVILCLIIFFIFSEWIIISTSNCIIEKNGTIEIKSNEYNSITKEDNEESLKEQEKNKKESSKKEEKIEESSKKEEKTEESSNEEVHDEESSDIVEESINKDVSQCSKEESKEPSFIVVSEDEKEYCEPSLEESEEEIISSSTYSQEPVYSPTDFYYSGVIKWGGWTWTYYSEVYMPGTALPIPGRWTDENGYVCDENNYICLASSSLPKGTIVDTPFGKMGKVYDCGCLSYILDVYVSWY